MAHFHTCKSGRCGSAQFKFGLSHVEGDASRPTHPELYDPLLITCIRFNRAIRRIFKVSFETFQSPTVLLWITLDFRLYEYGCPPRHHTCADIFSQVSEGEWRTT